MLDHYGVDAYRGLDFSEVAVSMARKTVPHFDFRQADARTPSGYEGFDCDAVICMEVLEHIEDDLDVISNFPTGPLCLMTVPNFPWRSHVRCFETEDSVHERYGELFNNLDVTRIRSVRGKNHCFFLMSGTRVESAS
jgi:trans-aconitate methyltransferase